MWHFLYEHLNIVAILLAIPPAIFASSHAILWKRDVRAAFAWAVFSLAIPYIGPLFYWLFGINRIQRKAIRLRKKKARPDFPSKTGKYNRFALPECFGKEDEYFYPLINVVGELTKLPPLSNNKIQPLFNGDEAYPEMFKAIEQAEHSISLLTYIFDNDRAGKKFREHLNNAKKRGVEIRILIDDMGRRYSWSPINSLLEEDGIPTALFMPTYHPWKMKFINLRNHRKILVVDGKIGFTGGMNIREGNLLKMNPESPIQDIHFKLEGPIVSHLQETFATDWAYTTGEVLDSEIWFPSIVSQGKTLARGISDGPDKSIDLIRWTILGALSTAQKSIRIITPYFLPDQTLITSLNLAAMRGVKVEIILPEESNLKTVQWASTAMLWQVLQYGCHVYLSPPPFDHSKLMVIDESWTLLGSANWDPRSLRLNFEFNVEAYDKELAKKLHAELGARIKKSREITHQEVNSRSLPVRLRDGLFRLMTPYL